MEAELCGRCSILQNETIREEEALSEVEIFQIQLLFRAVAVVIDGNNHEIYEDETCNTPVYLVQIGVEDSLSAPIDFASLHEDIKVEHYAGQNGKTRQMAHTTIQKAFDVVMKFERREKSAFGMKADRPPASARWGNVNRVWDNDLYKSVEQQARRLGWEGEFDVPVSSSGWVDEIAFPQWIGLGAYRVKQLEKNDDRFRR